MTLEFAGQACGFTHAHTGAITALSPSSCSFDGVLVWLLLSRLPAVDELSEQQVLQVLKAAVRHDGLMFAKRRGRHSRGHKATDDEMFPTFESLVWDLSPDTTVELVEYAIHYK